MRKREPFDIEKLQTPSWSGVDIRKESQGLARASNSIQFKMIDWLKQNGGYAIVFDDDDDGAGAAADIVAVRVVEEVRPWRIDVEFYHCKFAGGNAPGGRVDDLYVVCGQAQRSVVWLHSKIAELTRDYAMFVVTNDLRVMHAFREAMEEALPDVTARLVQTRITGLHLHAISARSPDVGHRRHSGPQSVRRPGRLFCANADG